MANRNSVSESNPALRNQKKINTFKIRHCKLSYGIFFSNCYIQREKERQFSTYFSVVSSTVKIPKFCVSICHTLRGPGGLALGGECSPFPSAVSLRSCFPPLPHPTQLYLQLRHLPAGCCAKMPWWTRAPRCCPRSREDLLKDIVFKNSQCSAFWWI